MCKKEAEEEEDETEGVWRKLACLCCDPSFFFLPCLLEGTKERQCQDVESISPSSGHRAALPASYHKENIILIYWLCLKPSPQVLDVLKSERYEVDDGSITLRMMSGLSTQKPSLGHF